jgi:hypothetical protein
VLEYVVAHVSASLRLCVAIGMGPQGVFGPYPQQQQGPVGCVSLNEFSRVGHSNLRTAAFELLARASNSRAMRNLTQFSEGLGCRTHVAVYMICLPVEPRHDQRDGPGMELP